MATWRTWFVGHFSCIHILIAAILFQIFHCRNYVKRYVNYVGHVRWRAVDRSIDNVQLCARWAVWAGDRGALGQPSPSQTGRQRRRLLRWWVLFVCFAPIMLYHRGQFTSSSSAVEIFKILSLVRLLGYIMAVSSLTSVPVFTTSPDGKNGCSVIQCIYYPKVATCASCIFQFMFVYMYV